MPTAKLGPSRRREYAHLRTLTPRDEPCKVPACTEPSLTEDCCRGHSLNKPIGNTATGILPNDGTIDWLAIDIAVEGLRPVKLTWVEFEIALATLIANGREEFEAAHRMLLPRFPQAAGRRARIYAMADAIKQERVRA